MSKRKARNPIEGITAPPEDPSAEPGAARRRRYVRAPAPPLTALTPVRVRLLRFLAECRFLSLPQLARLACPSGRADLSEKRARRHMRALFDAGLVDVLPVSRLALAPPDAPNDHSLLYGSAPNVYAPSPRGLETLYGAGLIEKGLLKRHAPGYGPKNSLFLAHELEVRDVRVWLEAAVQASAGEQRVLAWRDGVEAALDVGEGTARQARPDAWFAYRLRPEPDKRVLVGLVEVDRGTERGDRHWREKLEAYAALFSGDGLRAATGYVNARVLVFTPDARRRDRLAGLVTELGGPVAARFWLAECGALARPDLHADVWKRPGATALGPLVPR